MIHIGISDEGTPDFSLKKLENGYVVPDMSVEQLHRAHRKQTHDQVELAVAADELGYEYAVHPEHHFYLQGSVSPDPVLTQAAVASRTENIRLLQMANILPWHEPVRLAEQIAMLDILSDGRAEVGLGYGSATLESQTLGQYWGGTAVDEAKNRKSFDEKFELLVECWTEDLVSHHGEFHSVPPSYTEWHNDQEYHYLADDVSGHDPAEYMQVDPSTHKTTLQSLPVIPQPQQDPHPQLWKPAATGKTLQWAAQRGINACMHCSDFSVVKNGIDVYHESAEEAGWPDHRPEYDGEPFRRGWDGERHRGVAAILNVFNTEIADADTFERWKLGMEFALTRKQSKKDLEADEEIGADVDAVIEEGDTPVVGDTEEIIDRLATYRDTCGYEDFVVFVQTKVSGMTHEENRKQLRAFAEDVVPQLEE